MDSSGVADVDDQGSGWFQVKKKHRSSSKFSIGKWIGGSSRQQANGKGRNSGNKNQPQASIPEKDSVHKSSLDHSSTSKEDEKNESCLDKRVVGGDNECMNSPPPKDITTTASKNSSTGNASLSDKTPIIMPKIKWGDLDDDLLDNETSSVSEIKFGEIGNDDLTVCETTSKPVISKEIVEVLTSSSDACPNIPTPIEDSLEENRNKTGEVVDADLEPSKVEFPSSTDETRPSTVKIDHVDTEVIIAEDTEASQSNQHLPEASRTSNSAVQEEGESKERFRERLWCFLFENLNRAVDELYLLCELECDLEQLKEAVLVLQEAESDFRELNVRVAEFDKLKKNTSRTVRSMKGDHRRPHALSWEVRRMTTSPHRAEILSSSLEAFKKVQEERAKERASAGESITTSQTRTCSPVTIDSHTGSKTSDPSEPGPRLRRKSGISDSGRSSKTSVQSSHISPSTSGRSSKILVQNSRVSPSNSSDLNTNKFPTRIVSLSPLGGKVRAEGLGSLTEVEKRFDSVDPVKRHSSERRKSQSWKPADAWKEKRNWEEILASPSRLSYSSSCMSRKSVERARILHDKLMSPEKRKKTSLDLKKEAEEKHARATRIRNELEGERIQKLQRTSEKLNRASERQAVRSMKLKEVIHARHQQSESRHEAYIAKVVKRAGDESNKVNEVRFITSLNEENKKFMLRQKLHDSELRRAEKIQVLKIKQKEDVAREEAVMERRKLIEAEKLQRLAETQKKKEEALIRREEERKVSSALREARTMEQIRRKEERAKLQQEEAELLAQKLAEKLRESEQRRKIYLEQIRERASINFRDQSSPLMRRVVTKEGQGRTSPPANGNVEDIQENASLGCCVSSSQSLKRRIKKIRERLMALKHDIPEVPVVENIGIGYRTGMGIARAKIGRWIQELLRLRQERKEGAANIGLRVAEIIKFLEGKELELLASRRAGLLDFISSALPASHISKPEASQVTIYLLRLLKVVLCMPSNRAYFLAQNLLPPLIPILSAALESYIKIAASLNISLTKTSENFDSISEVLDGLLTTVTMIIGFPTLDEKQRQMQGGLLELIISYQITHRLRDLFALYDRPQVEGSPFPSSILLSINLLVALTSRPSAFSAINWESFPISENDKEKSGFMMVDDSQGFSVEEIQVEQGIIPTESNCGDTMMGFEVLDSQKVSETNTSNMDVSVKEDTNSASYSGVCRKDGEHMGVKKQPHGFLLSAFSETGLVSLPSLLTAVLLQANSKSSEQGSYVLPSNFEEVATGVLRVLNNLALMDVTFMQQMLARPDLKMEFFHIMSFLLTHCTNSWKVSSDQVGLLLLESLLLLGYFSLFYPGNQAVLRWGNSPTILHKVCDLPFAFFSDLELMPILAGTLVAACFGCEQNKDVVQQELSTDMIISLIKSSKNTPGNSAEDLIKNSTLEPKKPSRGSTLKNSRLLNANKNIATGNSINRGKLRSIKDGKISISSEDNTSKPKMEGMLEGYGTLPLYARFPESFIGRAEIFFS